MFHDAPDCFSFSWLLISLSMSILVLMNHFMHLMCSHSSYTTMSHGFRVKHLEQEQEQDDSLPYVSCLWRHRDDSGSPGWFRAGLDSQHYNANYFSRSLRLLINFQQAYVLTLLLTAQNTQYTDLCHVQLNLSLPIHRTDFSQPARKLQAAIQSPFSIQPPRNSNK